MSYIELLLTEPYNFLRTNEHLGDNIMYLTLGGSHAYGTAIEGSDVDIRGIAMERTQDLLGFTPFEQVIDAPTDTTIYGFKKAVQLLSACNPNMIELLYTKPEHVLYMSPAGKVLRDNRDLFLSRKAANAFGGYATAQLKRLQNALARDVYTPARKEEHMMVAVTNAMRSFEDRYGFAGKIRLFIGPWRQEEDTNLDTGELPAEQMLVDMDIRGYPLRAVRGMMSEMTNVISEYSKVNHRNRKKDEPHLYKHAMHLLRLLQTGTRILEGREMSTFCENSEFLLDVRNGKWSFEALTTNIDHATAQFQYAEKHTELPKNPDFKRIEEMVISLTKEVIIDDATH